MNRRILKVTLLFFVVMLMGSLSGSTVQAQSLNLVVNQDGDRSDFDQGDGICDTVRIVPGSQWSLRAAIEEAIAAGVEETPHSITFNIQSDERVVIKPQTPYPWINVPIHIDGTTQSGASCTTADNPAVLQIFLDGSEVESNGSSVDGFLLIDGSSNSTIKGLIIGNFTGSGIRMLSDFNRIECNHIGVEPELDPLVDIGNNLQGITMSGNDNIVGGFESIATRNVISGNRGSGISLSFGKRNQILNNYIGLTQDGRLRIGNGSGISISGDHNMVGDGSEIGKNIVVNSDGTNGNGISISFGNHNSILGNYIGLSPTTSTLMGNGGAGVVIRGNAQFNTIGSLTAPNIIAHNGRDGVQIVEGNVENGDEFPENNMLRGNSIFSNRDLGIDVDDDGVTAEKIPQIMVEESRILVLMEGEPQTQYIVDIFRNDQCDFSGYGEGQELLTQVEVVTNLEGSGFEIIDLPDGIKLGDAISATASDSDTSEFS